MKCTFCNNELERGTGKMYVKVDGKIMYFCSSKCEHNVLKLKRNPVRFKWTNKEKKKVE